jgi:hypothetical protein
MQSMPEEVPLQPEDESSLERLRARLYAQEAPPQFVPPMLSSAPLSPEAARLPQNFSELKKPEIPPSWITRPKPEPQKPRISWAVLFFGFAVLFFVLAGVGSYVFLIMGGNAVSSNNIAITVTGPSTIASGTTVPLVITIKNNNGAAITQPDITLTYPDGTRSADDVTQPLLRYADTLGTIPAHGSATVNVQAVLFGSINQSQSIPIMFQYNTNGSDALFTKSQNYSYTITSSPLSITSQAVSSVSSGQPFTIALAVRSNASSPLDSIAVSAQYPTGFIVQRVQMEGATKAQAAALTPNTAAFLPIGTLAPGEEKDFTITGILSGTENTQNAFQFTVGTQTAGEQTLSVGYASQTSNITITQPFLSATLSMNHADTDPTVVTAGQSVAGMITWMNSLATSIANAQVQIQLSGNALDPSSVVAQNGYFDSSKDTILYTQQTQSSLANLAAGVTGNGTFSFQTKSGPTLNALRNPTVTLNVSVAGQPNGGSPQTLTNSVTKTIEVQTDLELASRIVRTIGAFKNTGPWPPTPNQATTYTVQLAVTNTVNSVGGATATMILPAYVTFTGQTSPSDGSIKYDPASNTVTWTIGDVAAGTGSATAATDASFQISFTPSDTQALTEPVLVGNQTITGVDRFTGTTVGGTAPALTTQASTDPGYQASFGTVAN